MTLISRSLFAVFALAVAAIAAAPTSALAEAADRVSPPEGYPERVLGDPDAPVTIYEYSSLTCSHCANFHTGTLPQLKEAFIDSGKAKLVLRDFPLDRLALAGALLARCAPEPMYFRLMDVLFAQQQQWARADQPLEALKGFARLAGMSNETIDACFANEDLLTQIQSVQDQAQKRYNITSTPTFVVGGQVLPGNRTLKEFEAAIEAAN